MADQATALAALGCAFARAANSSNKHLRQCMASALALSGHNLEHGVHHLPPPHLAAMVVGLAELKVLPHPKATDAMAVAILKHRTAYSLSELALLTYCIEVLQPSNAAMTSEHALMLLGELDTRMALKVCVEMLWIVGCTRTYNKKAFACCRCVSGCFGVLLVVLVVVL